MKARQWTGPGVILAALMVGLLAAEPGGAQSGRPWVDPPGQADAPPPESAPAQPPAARPEPPVAPAQPRTIDPPSGSETRAEPPSRPSPDTDQASPAPRAPAPTRTDRAPPPDMARPRPDEVPRTSPPARSAEPPRSPEPEAPAYGERRQRGSDHAGAAREFAVAYLAYWSAPNAIALDATPDFYAPQILFHGRQLSARALFEEKRRFVRRWPVRDYQPRLETMRTTCDPAPPICTVRTMFDFAASSPQTGKQSRGTALLQLGVSFSGGEPMIVFESSQVTSRGPSSRSEAFEDAEDD